MVIHEEKDPNVWKAPQVDHNELQEAKKYATPERKVIVCLSKFDMYAIVL